MFHVYVGVKRHKTIILLFSNTLSSVLLVMHLVSFQLAFFKLSHGQYLGNVKVQLLQPIDTKIKIQKSPYDKTLSS